MQSVSCKECIDHLDLPDPKEIWCHHWLKYYPADHSCPEYQDKQMRDFGPLEKMEKGK